MTHWIVKATTEDGTSGEIFEVDAATEDAARGAYLEYANRQYAEPFVGPARTPVEQSLPDGGAFPVITVTAA